MRLPALWNRPRELSCLSVVTCRDLVQKVFASHGAELSREGEADGHRPDNIVLIVILGGGGGYYAHGRYGGTGVGGVLGVILLVLIILWLVGLLTPLSPVAHL